MTYRLPRGCVSLLHMDGANGATSIVDEAGIPWTLVGNTALDTTIYKFGGASLLSDGNSDYARASGEAAFAFATNNFCIEFWMHLTAKDRLQLLYDSRPGANGLYPTIYISAANKLIFFTNTGDRITGTTSLTTGVLYHVALSRVAGSTRLFLEGGQEGSTYTDSNSYINGASRPMILNGYDGAYSFAGRIDEMAVWKNVARYANNFTPPPRPFMPPMLSVM